VNPDEWAFSHTDPDDGDSILALGPLMEESGFADVIEAVRTLRDRGRVTRLTIVGEGEDGELCARILRAGVGNQVTVIPTLSQPELAMLMRAHTVLVLPSLADYRYRDDLANVALAATSVGLLVLCPELPGIRELIDDGLTGRVMSPNDPSWLAGALDTLFSSRQLRDRMVHRARRKVERQFAASQNVPNLARLFLEYGTRTRRSAQTGA
jgi:glycosyltransferase involved in cell wall biosynthesis